MAEGKQIASLFALLGFQIDDKNLLKFKLGMVAAVGAVAKFAADVVKATVDLDNFNKTTGISVDLVRDWQIIAEQSNVSADSITSTFESIAKMKGDLMAGKNIGSAWAMLGITGNEDPEYIFNKVLEELGKIKDINLRNTRIADLGFDPQLVNLIGKTRQSLDGIFKDLKLTEKERKSLLEVKKSFTDLRLMLSMLKEKFVALFFPIKMFIDLATRIYMIIYKVIDSTLGWENAIKILGVVFAGLLVIFAPVTFALTALALAIEDVWTYFEGGDSYFGDFVKSAGVLGEVIAGLVQGFGLFIKAGLEGLPNVFGVLGGLFQGFLKMLEAVYEGLMQLIEPFKIVYKYSVGLTNDGINFVKGFFKKNNKSKTETDENFSLDERFNNGLNPNLSQSILPNINNSKFSQTITIQQQNSFEINGAENPQTTGNIVSNTLNDQINASVLQQQTNN